MKLSTREIVDLVIVICLGVGGAYAVTTLLPGPVSMLSPQGTRLMALASGVALGLLPWGIWIAETGWGRFVLLSVFIFLLVEVLIGGVWIEMLISPVHVQFTGTGLPTIAIYQGPVLVGSITPLFQVGAVMLAALLAGGLFTRIIGPERSWTLSAAAHSVEIGCADHSMFIGIWVCLLGIYGVGLVWIGRVWLSTGGLLPLLIGLLSTGVIVEVHQTLIGERKRRLSG